MNALRRLPVFFVVCLLVLLPVSVAGQIAASTSQGYLPPQQEPKASDLAPESDFSVQAVCVWPNKDCAGGCWTPCSSGTWYCGSTGAICCSSSAKFCADKCWTQCSADYIWVCTSSGAVCEPKSKCTNPSYPIPCGGGCWSSCGSGYRFECESGSGQCKLESCTNPSYPYWCGNSCWSGCGAGYDFVCNSGKGECKSQCTDNDGDGYGSPGSSSCPKGSATDCNDNNANVNPGMAEVCSDGIDNDCDGKADGADTDCCPSTHPNYCLKNNLCWKESWMCENSIKCGSTWQVCGSSPETAYCDDSTLVCCPSDRPYYINGKCEKCMGDFPIECGGKCWTTCGAGSVFNCNSGDPKCCPDDFPVYCQRTDSGGKNACWKSQPECDAAQKCGSEGWTVCREPGFPYWNCRSDGVSRCCPTGYPYLWNSDYLCHTTPESVVACTVPDGSSSQCDCNSNSDCPLEKPFCEENYPPPFSDGYDACIATPPEYCGDGKCAGSETFSSCPADCGGGAPKGTVNVAAVYNSGILKDKPLVGAHVYLDNVKKGNTGSDGKLAFETAYGTRTVKVECPDSSPCGSWSVEVKGAEFKSVRCDCNPLSDSDGDGYSDADELLLGTDPKDANSNFKTTFASDSVDLLACIPTPASFFILWKEYKKSGSIIESHSLVVNALNVTSVVSMSFEERPYVVAEALAAANLDAEGVEVIVNPVNVTLENVMKKAEYVDGVRMQDGILLIATDKDGQTTALIAIGAGCVGAFTGAAYGIGQGLFDDIKGAIDGIWFLITHLGEVKKIWSGAKELVAGIAELGKNLDETFWSMFRGILGKGKSINLFREEGGLNKPEPYRHFQVGFFYGFVTGYIVEQVALGAFILSKVAKAFKLGQLFGKAGKAAKLLEKLEIIKGSEQFGAEIAEKLSKLKYLKEGIDNWLDSEIKGLARIMKHNENWLKGLSEAEAKVAAKHADDLVAAGKVTDAAFGGLTKTKLGQHTLKAADATDDLLVKQSKLVSKWGVSKADEVVSKCFFFICYGNRIDDLNKILKAMPEGIVDGFDSQKAVKFLGNSIFAKTSEKIAAEFDIETLSKLDNLDDFEKTVNGADAILKKFNSLNDFKIALKICNSPCRLLTKEEFLQNLKNLGFAISKKIEFIDFDKLTDKAKATIKRMEDGGPFPFDEDGGTFKNVENLLPNQPIGYYKEYTSVLDTDAVRGIERIVTGANGEIYYTADHYKTFKAVIKNG